MFPFGGGVNSGNGHGPSKLRVNVPCPYEKAE
jgi:hypothetical protein